MSGAKLIETKPINEKKVERTINNIVSYDKSCMAQSLKCVEAFKNLSGSLNTAQKEMLFTYESEIASYERFMIDALSRFVYKELNKN